MIPRGHISSIYSFHFFLSAGSITHYRDTSSDPRLDLLVSVPEAAESQAATVPTPSLLLVNHRMLCIKLTNSQNTNASVNEQHRGGASRDDVCEITASLLSEPQSVVIATFLRAL